MRVISKTALMAKVIAGIAHEAFEHTDEGSFDITLMREAALRGDYGDPWESELSQEHVDFIRNNRDWERARVKALYRDRSKPWNEPVLAIEMGDGTHLHCDGTHRILVRWKLGLRNFFYWNVPLDKVIRPGPNLITNPFLDWGRFEQRPDGLYNRISGEKLKGT